MIHLDIQEPDTLIWRKWRRRCTIEKQTLIEEVDWGRKPKINKNLYRTQKKAIRDLYHQKCAYCEHPISRFREDLDHYRPKGPVRDENNRLVVVSHPDGTQGSHPGYYWLAYDWKNLLPACHFCNRPNRVEFEDEPAEVRIGKWDQFPVKNGNWAVRPGDELREEPLLLNPLEIDPREHLNLDIDKGIFYALTDEGETTVRVLGLNHDDLIDGRKKAYAYFYTQAETCFSTRTTEAKREEAMKNCKDAFDGVVAFSSVARLAINDVIQSEEKKWQFKAKTIDRLRAD